MLLSKEGWRPGLSKKGNPIETDIIDLPDSNNKGDWSIEYSIKIENAKESLLISKEVEETINNLLNNNSKNKYTLAIYNQVNELVKFSAKAILILEKLDISQGLDQKKSLEEIKSLQNKFDSLRINFEKIYSKTRILNKPEDYILDQDHHSHPANQTINFDWQFLSEILFLKKLKNLDHYEKL
jgi:IS30 family transposase